MGVWEGVVGWEEVGGSEVISDYMLSASEVFIERYFREGMCSSSKVELSKRTGDPRSLL